MFIDEIKALIVCHTFLFVWYEERYMSLRSGVSLMPGVNYYVS